MSFGNSSFGFSGGGSGGGGGSIGGGGTLNYISKFTPDGIHIGNSLLFDNGFSVGLGTVTPDVSAALDITSTTQGFLTPRMTQSERNAIGTPATGLLIFNTTSLHFNFWNGSAWLVIESSTITSDTLSQVLAAGNTTGGLPIVMTSGDTLNFSVGSGGILNSLTTTAPRTWNLPDASGTIALTSDIPSTAITLNVIPKGTGTGIADGSWQFSTNDILPTTTGSNIGDGTHRIGTIFMSSVFDYANDLTFYNGTATTMTLTTTGNLGVGQTNPQARLHVSGGGVQIGDSGNDQSLVFGGTNASIIWGNPASGASIGYNVGSLYFSSVGASNAMVLQATTGNVGIGTLSPLNTLSVNGNIEITSNANTLKFNNTTILAVSQGAGATNIMLGRNATGIDGGNGGFIAIGDGASSIDDSISIGLNASCDSSSSDSIAIGRSALVNGGAVRGMAIGRNANAAFSNSFALGFNTTTTDYNQYLYGDNTVRYHGFGGVTAANTRVTITGRDNTSTQYGLIVQDNIANPLFVVRNDGNIGIGTNSPSHFIEANGGTQDNVRFYLSSTGLNTGVVVDSGGYPVLSLRTNGVPDLDIQGGGGVVYFRPNNNVEWRDYTNTSVAGFTGLSGANSKSYFLMNLGVGVSSPIARSHSFGVDATTNINQRLEPVSGVTEDTLGATINTTDATANVVLQSLPISTGTVQYIIATVNYRKTAGAGVGSIGQGTTFKLSASVQNIGGVLTIDTIQNDYTGTVNAIAGVTATLLVSGTNINVVVTGVVSDTIKWDVITKVIQ